MASSKRRAARKQKKDGDRKKDKGSNALGVPPVYQKRKTYGAGGKQVAWEEFDRPRKLKQRTIGSCLEYTLDPAFPTDAVTLTITHNDGTTQQWRIVSQGEEAGTTPGVHICYDEQGRPTSLYVLG